MPGAVAGRECVAPTLTGPGALEVFARATVVLSSCCRIGGALEMAARMLLVAFSVLGRFPNEARLSLIVRAAYLLMDSGESSSAHNLLSTAAALQPNSPASMRLSFATALAHIYSGNYTQGTAQLHLLTATNLGSLLPRFEAGVYNNLASALVSLGNLEGARGALDSAEGCVTIADSYSQGIVAVTKGLWLRKIGEPGSATRYRKKGSPQIGVGSFVALQMPCGRRGKPETPALPRLTAPPTGPAAAAIGAQACVQGAGRGSGAVNTGVQGISLPLPAEITHCKLRRVRKKRLAY